MSTQLTLLNMPTREDLSRLGEVVAGVEEKVDQLHEFAGCLQEAVDQPNKQTARIEKQLAQQVEASASETKPPAAAEATAPTERSARDGAGRRTGDGTAST